MTFQQQMESLGFVIVSRHYMSWYELKLNSGASITVQTVEDSTAPSNYTDEVEVAVLDDSGKDIEAYTWEETDLAMLVNMIKELNRGNA
jgi:hypothetical protein